MHASEYRKVTMHELKNGDLVTCEAGVFRIGGRRVSKGHREMLTPAVSFDAPETSTDVLVFDGVAVDPGQQIQKFTLQGNHLRTVGRVIED